MRGFSIDRSAVEPGGFIHSFLDGKVKPWPREWAAMVGDEPVTWAEVHAHRAERDRENLEHKTRPAPPPFRPCAVWTFKVPGFLYGGWHLYVLTADSVNRRRDRGEWIREDGFGSRQLADIRRAYPCGARGQDFYAWKRLFAKAHPKPHQKWKTRPEGWAIGWLLQDGRFAPTVAERDRILHPASWLDPQFTPTW